MIIRVWSETAFVGADREDELELPDDATEQDIAEEARNWFWDHYNYGWERKEEQSQ